MSLLVCCDGLVPDDLPRGLLFVFLMLPTLHTAAVSATLHFCIKLIFGQLHKGTVADASLK